MILTLRWKQSRLNGLKLFKRLSELNTNKRQYYPQRVRMKKKKPLGSMNQLECKVRWQRICELMCCFINHTNSINQWLWILSNSFKLRGNSCIFHNSYFLKQKRGYFQTCQLSWHLVNCWEAEWFIWNWMIYSKQTWTHSIRTPRGTQHANRLSMQTDAIMTQLPFFDTVTKILRR